MAVDIYLKIERDRKESQENERWEKLKKFEEQKSKQIEEGKEFERTPEEEGIISEDMLNLRCEWENIHNKVVFDAINEALDGCRPYGLKGPPLPWSKQTRALTNKNQDVKQIQRILTDINSKVMGWVKTYAGTMQFSELLKEFKIPYLEEEQLN